MAKICIEVAYGESHRQRIIALEVEAGTSLYDAVLLSDIAKEFVELDLSNTPMGIFSKLCANPKQQAVQDGQRIELYRPLQIDPKQARIKRAAKQQST